MVVQLLQSNPSCTCWTKPLVRCTHCCCAEACVVLWKALDSSGLAVSRASIRGLSSPALGFQAICSPGLLCHHLHALQGLSWEVAHTTLLAAVLWKGLPERESDLICGPCCRARGQGLCLCVPSEARSPAAWLSRQNCAQTEPQGRGHRRGNTRRAQCHPCHACHLQTAGGFCKCL